MNTQAGNPLCAASDEELCEIVRQGGVGAVETLVLRYLPMIRRQAAAYKGGRVEPEDLMQEGLIGLFRAIKAYDPSRGAGFKTFAYTCAANRILSAMMTAKPRPGGCGISDNPSSFDPEQFVIEQERYISLMSSIRNILSKLEYQVLRLHLEGSSYEQIATDLKVATKAVDNALQRVRRKLKAVL